MTRYLVTGGAGFIGSNLVKRLIRQGHDVTVLDDCSRGQESRLAEFYSGYWGSLNLIKGDVQDFNTVGRAIGSPHADVIVHLAYKQGTQTFYSSPDEVLDVALRGILAVADAVRFYDVRNLLVVSSSEAYQVASIVPTPETIPLTVPDVLNPRYSYGGGKIIHELMASSLASRGFLDRAMIVRPHNIIGRDMGREHVVPEFALRMKNLVMTYPEGVIEFPIQGSGQETRSFCYIDDCIDQLTAVLEGAPQGASVWNIGTDEEHSVSEVAHTVARVFDREIKVIPGKLPEGSPVRRKPDVTKIRNLLEEQYGHEFTPTEFDDAIYGTVRWYQENA